MRYEHHWSEGRVFRRRIWDFACRMKRPRSCHIVFDAPKRQIVVRKFERRIYS